MCFTYRGHQTTAAQEFESFPPRTEFSSPANAAYWDLCELHTHRQEIAMNSYLDRFNPIHFYEKQLTLQKPPPYQVISVYF